MPMPTTILNNTWYLIDTSSSAASEIRSAGPCHLTQTDKRTTAGGWYSNAVTEMPTRRDMTIRPAKGVMSITADFQPSAGSHTTPHEDAKVHCRNIISHGHLGRSKKAMTRRPEMINKMMICGRTTSEMMETSQLKSERAVHNTRIECQSSEAT